MQKNGGSTVNVDTASANSGVQPAFAGVREHCLGSSKNQSKEASMKVTLKRWQEELRPLCVLIGGELVHGIGGHGVCDFGRGTDPMVGISGVML